MTRPGDFDDGRKCLFIASEVRCGSTFIAETIAYELNKSFGFELWDLAKEHFSFLDENATPKQALEPRPCLHLAISGFVAAKILCKGLSQLHRLAQLSSKVREAFFGDRDYWIILR